jgi:hypothetical protein
MGKAIINIKNRYFFITYYKNLTNIGISSKKEVQETEPGHRNPFYK